MSLTIVVGGQLGDEGKGATIAYLAQHCGTALNIRTGGPNAGHCITIEGKTFETHHVSPACINPDTILAIPAGAIISPEILLREIEEMSDALGRDIRKNILIDPKAFVLQEGDATWERNIDLNSHIASYQSGVGAATARRIKRHPHDCRLAGQVPELILFCGGVVERANYYLKRAAHVTIEGTQGFGLSLYHGDCYPYATSRDTTAAGALSEAGLSPLAVDNIIMCVRTWPIRVPGNSGPLEKEMDWDAVAKHCGAPGWAAVCDVETMVGVTSPKRVGRFNGTEVLRSVAANRPTFLSVHGIDLIDWHDRGAKGNIMDLSGKSQGFIGDLEQLCSVKVGLVSTGPGMEEFACSDAFAAMFVR